jgi:phage terminase small subunit
MVEPNPELHDVAKAALEEAKVVLGADFDRFRAAVNRYVNAVEVADGARREWERVGRPWTSEGSMRQETEHPLIRTMERLDSAAMRFGAVLGLDPQSSTRMKRGVGRPVGSTSAPDRKAPPEVKLKAVG